MLRSMHKHKRSIGTIFIFMAIAIMMTGFGLDSYLGSRNQPYAIRVNDEEVTFAEFYEAKRNIEAQMRQMYGAQFDQIASMIGFNAARQTADRVVAEKTLGQAAKSLGLTVGDQEVFETIQARYFPSGFNHSAYIGYLKSIQKSPLEFENEIRAESLAGTLYELVRHTSIPSEMEARSAAVIEKTKYSVEYLEFDPASAVSKVAEPSQEQLESFYKERAGEYQTQPRISYSYIAFSPKEIADSITIAPEDIEFYYSENETQFMDPEQVRLRAVDFKVDTKATDKDREKVKAGADEVLKKIKEGASFEEMAKKHSADKTLAAKGGELGWKNRESMLPYVAQIAFRLNAGEVSDVISVPQGYQIIKVEEKKEKSLKPLDSVKDEIVKILRTEEAPAISAAKAYEMQKLWEKSGLTLKEFAEQQKLSYKATATPLTQASDPEPELAGLTEKAFGFVDSRRGLVDLKERTVIVEVGEFIETTLPSLASIKEKVVTDWKNAQSNTKAREIAEEALKSVRGEKPMSFADAVTKFGATKGELPDITMANANSPILATNDARRFVFSTSSTPTVGASVFSGGGKYQLLRVTKVTPPSAEDIQKELGASIKEEQSSLARATFESLLAKLKAKADIDVKSSVYGESGA